MGLSKNTQQPNEQQLSIIQFDKKCNVGIIAGPGSGKTFVLIEKIGFYLSEKKIEPKKILLVTYTNRGIIEIKRRIDKFVKSKQEFEYAGTLHSICKKFLEEEFRKELESLLKLEINRLHIFEGKDRDFFLSEEIQKWIKELIPGISADLESEIVDIVTEETENSISRNKVENYLNNNFQLKVQKYEWFSSRINEKIQRFSFAKERIIEVFKRVFISYQEHLDKREIFDFDDLIIYFHYLINNDPKKKKFIQSRFEKILVDEFQDMNFLQLLIISEISGPKKNIFFVGDPNQAIYGFQGAYPKIFNHFKTKIDITTIFFNLSQNYRSTKNILDLSTQLINNNDQKEIFNEMFTKNELGDKVSWILTDRQGRVSRQIYSIIKSLESRGVNLNQIAIISRTHVETKNLRRWFWQKGLKFIDFNFSKHISWNFESYFLVCLVSLKFRLDPFALRQVVQFWCKKNDIPDYLYELIEDSSPDLAENLRYLSETNFHGKWTSEEDKRHIRKVKLLWSLIRVFLNKNRIESNSEKYLRTIISSAEALRDWIKENVKSELIKVISAQKSLAVKNILQFYKVMTYYSDQVTFSIKELFDLLLSYVKHFVSHITEDNYLNFSTVHGAKGCEFDYVFILNLIEGRFPKHYAKTTADLEEERRILFVGMTRAKTKLYLVSDLYSITRRRKPQLSPVIASRKDPLQKISNFLKELDFLSPHNQAIDVLSNFNLKTHAFC